MYHIYITVSINVTVIIADDKSSPISKDNTAQIHSNKPAADLPGGGADLADEEDEAKHVSLLLSTYSLD